MTVSESFAGQDCELLIALHAGRSADSIVRFSQRYPQRPVVVALTGTDLHVELKQARSNRIIIESSLASADRIVVLEPEGAKRLKASLRKKVAVIFQSATRVEPRPVSLKRFFEVTVIGHLRTVKDPFRTATAVKLLPQDSRVRVVHIGKALTQQMETRALRETENNSRYRWIGRVSHNAAQQKLARSHLTVLSSRVEGAPSVISEAVVNDVPILATRIDASFGLLGRDHPGLFDVGDPKRLAELIDQAETDAKFYRRLVAAGKKVKPRFNRSSETRSWKKLLGELKG